MGPEQRLPLPESRWADVNGPVHYREWAGAPDGPAFVCLHGLGGSNLNWALVAPGLARRGRVIAVDLPGFGLTPLAGRGTSLGANWKLVNGLLGALELTPAILVGNSMGGVIAMIQAAHSPASVEALILVDAAFPRTAQLDGQFRPGTAALFAVYNSRRLGARVTETLARRLGPEGLVREALRAAEAFVEAAQSIFQAQLRPAKYRALVRAIACPALVIHGAMDQLVPLGTAETAVREHPNWRLVVFDDLGHIPQMEAPERWLAAVEGWLDDYLPAVLRSSSSDSPMA